jgi:hypothetical protein
MWRIFSCAKHASFLLQAPNIAPSSVLLKVFEPFKPEDELVVVTESKPL